MNNQKIKQFFLLLILTIYSSSLAVAQVSTGSDFGGTLSKVDVEVAAKQKAIMAGSDAQFAIILDIKDGWHLNAHNPPLDYLIGVDLSIEPSDNAIVSNIEYPNAQQMKFSFAQEVLDVYEGKVMILVEIKTPDGLKHGDYALVGNLQLQACSDSACLPPSQVQIQLPFSIGDQTVLAEQADLIEALEERDVTVAAGDAGQIASMFNEYGYFWAFLSIFLIGLALNLTPCVYPMMSVTISLFGGNENKQASMASAFSKAFVYLLGIVFMYSALGVMAAYTGNIFGSWLQSPWVLGGIGLLIFLLALSMFGLYELQPPARLMQKLGKAQNTSGYIGHFVSGLLVGIFAAPCIGPPIIALLAFVGAQGNPVFGFFAFFIMALGLGIPYLILGTFSGLLNKIPKSGVWMIWVKKVFGVILVGVALFYLALAFVPDLSMYAVLTTLVIGGLYLGFIERSGNANLLFRRFKYIAGAAALVAGFFLFQNLQKEGVVWQPYDPAIVEQVEKPVILDFYADWCIPCIEMDRKTFTDIHVIEETKPFIRMKVDLTHFDSDQAEKLRKEFEIAGVPTIIFLDSEGNEVEGSRVVGFLNAENFLERIKQAQQKKMVDNE